MVMDFNFDGHVGGAALWNFTLWYDDVSMLAQCPLQSSCCLVVESVSDTSPLANSRLTSMHSVTLTSETVGKA